MSISKEQNAIDSIMEYLNKIYDMEANNVYLGVYTYGGFAFKDGSVFVIASDDHSILWGNEYLQQLSSFLSFRTTDGGNNLVIRIIVNPANLSNAYEEMKNIKKMIDVVFDETGFFDKENATINLAIHELVADGIPAEIDNTYEEYTISEWLENEKYWYDKLYRWLKNYIIFKQQENEYIDNIDIMNSTNTNTSNTMRIHR